MNFKSVLSLTFCIIGLQVADAQPSAGTGTQSASSVAVQVVVDRLEREMSNIANEMPASKYDFTPASLGIPGAQFTKVRSFADEVRHVAQANYSIAASVSGTEEPTAVIAGIGEMKSKDEILAALKGSFAAMRRAIATITTANQNDLIEDVGVGPNQTRETEAMWCAVHGYDHYGQLVEYLRLNGIEPKP